MRYVLAIVFVLCSTVPSLAASATLTWQDNSANETAFDIERKSEACAGTAAPWAVLSTVAANVVTFKDLAVVEGASYCYRVDARNTAGKSGYSNTAGITINFTIPAAPSLLGVTQEP